MESMNSSAGEQQSTVEDHSPTQELSEQWLNERFESLLPKIQDQWPDLAKQTLEATRGSLDEVIRVISQHSGITNSSVQKQLEEILNNASNRTRDIADSLEPLEKQLEELLDDLNTTLRPRLEKPIRQRPLLAIGMAAGIGLIIGIIISGGKRS